MASEVRSALADGLFELWEITEGGAGRVYFLPNRTLTIGRAPDNDIVLPYQGVSRRHARLAPEGESFALLDLESHNGTLVNGEKVGRIVLSAGDILQFGRLTFEFRRARPEAAAARQEGVDIDQATLELSAQEVTQAVRPKGAPDARGSDLLIKVSQLLAQARDEASYIIEVLTLLQ